MFNLRESDRKLVLDGATFFHTVCLACYGHEGQGLPTKVAPSLISKFKLLEYKEGVDKILLYGLKEPVDEKNYPDQIPVMGANNDEWLASALNYLRCDLSMKNFPKMNEG